MTDLTSSKFSKTRKNNKITNENIISFLKEHYLFEEKTYFGILIKGAWGSGKTYLIKELMKKYKDKKKLNFIYISLYGLNSIDQVYEKLFNLLHPIITSKSFKFFMSVLKGTLAATTKISTENKESTTTKAKDISLSLPLSAFTEDNFKKNLKFDKVFIVDDMERCSIAPTEIFGFFSDFINENNAKVIFISNEDELLNNLEKQSDEKEKQPSEKKKYQIQKEKVIGLEFEITPDKESAINFFIKDYCLEPFSGYLKENTINITNILKCDNLRTIQQSYYYLNIILNILKDTKEYNTNKSNQIINDIVTYFLIIFIAKTNGKILSTENVKDCIKNFYSDISDSPFESIYSKKEYNAIPLFNLYYDMIIKGQFDKEKITSEYLQIVNPKEDKSNYLKNMKYQWHDFTDEKFKKYYDEIQKQLKKGNFTRISELWDYAELFQLFIDKKLIPDTHATLETNIKDYINKHRDKIELDLNPDDIIFNLHPDPEDNYESPLNKSKIIVESFFDFVTTQNKENLKKQIIQLFSQTTDSDLTILKTIDYAFNPDFPEFTVSLFEYITPVEFYKKISELSLKSQKEIVSKMRSTITEIVNYRYDTTIYNNVIPKFLEANKELSKLYKADANGTYNYSPEKLNKAILADEYQKLVDYINHPPKESI